MVTNTLTQLRVSPGVGPLRLLILEDNRQDLDLMLYELKESGLRPNCVFTQGKDEFLQALQDFDFDAVLSDYRLPNWTGLDAFSELQKSGKDIPFLLVTGTLGEEAAVDCIKRGVSDYILKEHLARLPEALERAVRERKLRQEAAKAQESLRKTQEMVRIQFEELELLYRTIPVCIAVLDSDLRYIRVNEAMAENHGMSPAEHIGKSLFDVVPAIAEEAAEQFRKVASAQRPVRNLERRIRRTVPPYEERDYLINLHPFISRGGSAIVCVMVDITERKKTELQLQQSEARYRVQVEHAPEAIVVFDLDLGCFVEANQNAVKLFGRTRLELMNLGPATLSPEKQPDGRSSFECATQYLREALLGKTPVFEWIHRNASGEDIPCEVRLVRMPSTNGRNLVRGSITDIRERKKAAATLRLTEARNRDLVENSEHGICRTSGAGKFLDANPAFLRILGCSNITELQSMNLGDDVFRFPEQYAKLMTQCRELGVVRDSDLEWKRRDGGLVAVRVHFRLLHLVQDAVEYELIAEDVTELRAMERQLRQAQKFEAIGQLAGGIAHDFNNVVGAILGWAEIGLDQCQNTPHADRFQRIREQAERAAALTRELLAFARRQVLQPRAVNLNEITSGLMNFLDKVIGKNIELKVITGSVDLVKADPTQIEQVLMNLCINARDAMPNGGRLMIETEMADLDEGYCRFYPHTHPGRYAVLSVSDTGMGMDAETKDRIFEPFFTTKEPGKGTGMGLATVYGVVKQHGGFIHVYSEPGQGTLFRIYVPAAPGVVPEGSASAQVVTAVAHSPGSEVVLLAEDHESIREMARQTLLNLGYRVLSAADGEEALRLCEKERPSLAVLDMVMPRMGGLAAAEKLKEKFPQIPILYTSGYSRDASGLPDVTSDAPYLQKPYSPTALGKLVRKVLDSGSSGEKS